MHIAIAIKSREKLLPSLKLLEKELARKAKEFKNIVKVGRTHLQMHSFNFGSRVSGYHFQLKNCISRIENSLKEIYYLAQGGTAVGTGLNTRKILIKKLLKKLVKLQNYRLNHL